MPESDKIVALYCRLSQKDLKTRISCSIQNQKIILQKYAKEHNLHNTQFFIDDGYSGRNNNRPAFRKMIARIMLGEIDTVIVKDFSRFSREHILTAEFLEKIFPENGIRFISITDNFDNIYNTLNLSTPFKSLFNEYYCKDISQKVKSALFAKKESGSYSTANVPFGYYIDTDGIKVQPNEAIVVKKIFSLAYNGYNCREIANILNEEIHFYSKKGVTLDSSYIWSVLSNPFYAGIHVWHKYEMDSGQSGKALRLPKSSWKTSKGKHQGIVSKELFDVVNSHHNPSKSVPKGRRHIFHGITKCKICHKALCAGRRKKEYLCCNHCGNGETKKIQIELLYKICLEKIVEECVKHHISFDKLNNNKENNLLLKELILQNFIKKIEIGNNYDIDIFWKFRSYNFK